MHAVLQDLQKPAKPAKLSTWTGRRWQVCSLEWFSVGESPIGPFSTVVKAPQTSSRRPRTRGPDKRFVWKVVTCVTQEHCAEDATGTNQVQESEADVRDMCRHTISFVQPGGLFTTRRAEVFQSEMSSSSLLEHHSRKVVKLDKAFDLHGPVILLASSCLTLELSSHTAWNAWNLRLAEASPGGPAARLAAIARHARVNDEVTSSGQAKQEATGRARAWP